MTQFYSSSLGSLEQRSRLFLVGIIQHYNGTAEEKLAKSIEFIDALLFKTRGEVSNPFNPTARELQEVLVYSRSILIPKIYNDLNKNEADPFSIHDWN